MSNSYSINTNMYNNPYYQLMNMENMLGYSFNNNAPSMANNYCMSLNRYNNGLYGNNYGYNTSPWAQYNNQSAYGYNPSFCGSGNGYYSDWMNNSTGFGMSATQNIQNQGQQNINSQGLSQEEIQALSDYYQSHNIIEEGFKGAVTGGLSFYAMENMQSLLHPINAFRGYKGLEADINGVKTVIDGSAKIFKGAAKDLWKTDSYLMQEAYDATHKLIRDGGAKGFYSKWLRQPIEAETVQKLTEEMKAALASNDPERIRLATERMKAARGMNGRIPAAFGKLKTWFGGKSGNFETAEARLKTKGEAVTKAVEESKAMSTAINEGKILTGLGNMVKIGFKKDFFGWMGFECLFGIGKIFKGFEKDASTGATQTLQTLGKAAGNAAGWCLGKAAGGLAGAKLGAMIGSACPGLGTAVGAIVGFIGGSIGQWAMGKLTNKIFGKDVVDKIEEKEMASTQEGQAQLINFAYEKAQAGEEMDAKTQQALNHAVNLYA